MNQGENFVANITERRNIVRWLNDTANSRSSDILRDAFPHKDASLGTSTTVITFRENILFSTRSSFVSHVSRNSFKVRSQENCALIKKLSWLRRVLRVVVGFLLPLVDRPHLASCCCNFELQSHSKYFSQVYLVCINQLEYVRMCYSFCFHVSFIKNY